LLCLVAPVMAGPISFATPSDGGYVADSNGQFWFPGSDVWSSGHSLAPSGLGLSGSTGSPLLTDGLGSDRFTGGGPLGPPSPAPIPEPNGLMVMFGSGLVGVLGLVRRKLRA
jgi:PEP-CTERM motif